MDITLDYVMTKSSARLIGLNPAVRAATIALIERSYSRGIPIVITQGLRTIAEQDALYAQGRTTPGSIVTNARGGRSFHNYGIAVDFALLLPDGRSVSWDMARNSNGNEEADWCEVVDVAKSLGFAWGGDWKTFKDAPHFEMTFGLSLNEWAAGKCPTAAQEAEVIACINVETESDCEMTADEKAEFCTLKDTVAALTAKSSQVCPEWAKEAVYAAKMAGLIDTADGGSYDFYRFVTIMHRAGTF